MRATLEVTGITLLNGTLLAVTAFLFGIRGPAFAFLLAWLTVTWIVVTGTHLHWRLPAAWYRLHPTERDGRLYERLGVRIAKRVLRRGPLSIFSRDLRLPTHPTPHDLHLLYLKMEDAETSHVLAFGVTLIAAIAAAFATWWDSAGWLFLFGVLINAYPVMLQRYNRGYLSHQSNPD